MSAPAPETRADRSSLHRVLDALGSRLSGQVKESGSRVQAYAFCPAHDDRTKPSLSVTWTDGDRGGKTLLNCHRGCDVRSVVDALGLTVSDTFDTPPARPDGKAKSTLTGKPVSRPRAKAAPSPAPERPSSGKWTKVADYIYADADGVPVCLVSRFTPDSPQKFLTKSYDRSGRRIATKTAPTPERRVLYQLPAVLGAIAAGDPVYVVEGEKDADAITAAGAVATTNLYGAGSWLPQYTETLRGAHVVLVPDRDGVNSTPPAAGYRHMLEVGNELAGVAASIRYAEAIAGKDAHDHLSAGHGLADLRPFDREHLLALIKGADEAAAELVDQAAEPADAATPAPAEPPSTPARQGKVIPIRKHVQAADDEDQDDDAGNGGGSGGGGGAGGGSGDDPKWVRKEIRDQFEAGPDGMFKLTYKVQEGERFVFAKELLPAHVRLTARMALDLGDGAPAELTAVDLAVSRSGEEEHILESIDRRRWESCSWVSELPWPAEFDNTTQGRSQLVKAITATSGDVPLTTIYGALGWREIGGRWHYLTGAGALTSSGWVDGIRIEVDASLQRFTLSEPPADLAELRSAIDASTTLLDAVDPRIAAPLLGAAYRAVLGRSRTTVMAVGGRGSGKSGLSAYVAQHYDPTARQDSMPGPGAGEEAATIVALEGLRYRAGDLVLPIDDVAPDKGIERASQRIAQIARSQYNQKGKERGSREGDRNRPVHPPRSLPLITAEDGTQVDSAESRIVSVPVNKNDVDVMNVLPALDQGGEPLLRSKLITAMVMHYADAMPLTDWLSQTRQQLAAELSDPHPIDIGLEARHSDSVADLAVGWRGMLDMALSAGALNEAEAADLWNRAWAGLVACKVRLIEGGSNRTAAERFRDLLASVLMSKRGCLESKDGNTPLNPTRYGWEENPSAGFDGVSHRRGDTVIGWTDGQRVWLHPGTAYPLLRRQGDAESDPLNYTKSRLGNALVEAGALRFRELPSGARRSTIVVRLGESQTPTDVWEFQHSWLFPDQDDTEGGDTPPAPAPTPPAPVLPSAGDRIANATGGVMGQAVAKSEVEAAAELPAPDGAPPSRLRSERKTEVKVGQVSPTDGPVRPAEPQTLSPAGTESPEALEDAQDDAQPVDQETAGRKWHSGTPRSREKFGGLGLVAEPDGVWVIRPDVRDHAPARLASTPVDLADLLDQAARLHLGHRLNVGRRRPPKDQGQVWIMPKLRKALGWAASMDEDPTPAQVKKVRAAIAAAGWTLAYRNGKTAPVRFWMQIRRTVDEGNGSSSEHVLDLVVPEWFAAESEFEELHVSAETLARRLGRYTGRLGVAWQWSPAVSGVQLAVVTRPKLLERGAQTMPPPALEPTTEGRFGYRRTPTPEEARHTHVHLFDFNGLYLGASRSLPLAWGEYVHEKSPAVDLKRPGYWLVDLPKWEHAYLPDPFVVNGRNKAGGKVWVTTPTMKTAVELLELDVQPIEGWLATETLSGEAKPKPYPGDPGSRGYGRLLEDWAARMRDARLALQGSTDADDAAVLKMVKATYAHGYGRFDRTDSRDSNHPMYRPDFRHTIMAQGRFSIMAKLLRAGDQGRFPVAVWMGDSVIFTSNSADPKTALPEGFTLGDELGQVSHDGTASMELLGDLFINRRPALRVRDDSRESGERRLTIAEAIRFVHRGGSVQVGPNEYLQLGLDAIIPGGE
ncbi:hypothetical protein ACI2LF_43770 [Kribbella sp. NPDC020789]